jgi:hypothetical protein
MSPGMMPEVQTYNGLVREETAETVVLDKEVFQTLLAA